MIRHLKKILLKEVIWLALIIAVSALIEFLIIELFDLHPVLSVKAQGFVGLLLIGYMIRMFARISKAKEVDNIADSSENGQKICE